MTHVGPGTPAAIFGRNLRRLRTSAGLSQEELAARSGLHRTYVSSVERGNRNVSLENIFALAEALKCEPRDLLAPPRDEEGD
ncbi:helix-turn-helix domain-containing protein [Chondromyces apiculatus]|uniref:helix-turn-helix domain-containing protein n=1 Tax=Chondromyces apiculatus TaxID=51 RepID=UPI001E3A43CF|nr:helix-turn-helix transcriptional regulator [Chondromyces apiculatus]